MFSPHGSIYHRLPFIIMKPEVIEAAQAGCLTVEVGCGGSPEQDLEVILFHPDGTKQFSGRFPLPQAAGWTDVQTTVAEGQQTVIPTQTPNGVIRYGQRAVEIVDVQFLDEYEQESLQCEVGTVMRVRLAYRINDPHFCERPTIIVAFQKDGVVRSHRFWTDQVQLSAAEGRDGVLEIVANR